MEKENKKTGILGIGNLLLSDESFGIHVTRYLEEEYLFPDTVTIIDGGTAGIYMAPFLETHDPVFVVDVVNLKGAAPGTLYTFTADEARNGSMQTRMSPHQLGILEILDICKLRDISPETVEFFCVVPESLATGLEMSDSVAVQVKKIGDLLVQRLKELGHAICPQNSKNEKSCHA
ncbi:MAG: HyaD/HybD family hydrogenase maturation endopeptidase [Proteobacteria bacterium]|nr:HyaD/HybD family hydrogenase maturation endopeptidase [Pseudomonadota bacterium]MBU1137961.1 HyaD/HybD family hydrogenase maturation endopeptidase [Pseudomonadota bacterium]MBU1232625.1 HyaD/HybD family hydrogenase maturation endopeptidase [Pseudomonadota bacterium]MBU1420304.1 HyaD/HybD family hydrogenase maturation endopeptidase [Pseudomonadota bacterium]MBU1455633.1 HyaD/HybD family hydrogenase maturation endopeptidase [Pseudomonadota bacterium]